MLIVADKFRPLVMLVMFVLSLILLLARGLHHALVIALDGLAPQGLALVLPHSLGILQVLLFWCLPVVVLVGQSLLLNLLHFRVAARWWLGAQIGLIIVVGLFSGLFGLFNGFEMIPNLGWLLWLQVATFQQMIVVDRLQVRVSKWWSLFGWLLLGVVGIAGVLAGTLAFVDVWLGLLLSYFWWLLAAQIYFTQARTWQTKWRLTGKI